MLQISQLEIKPQRTETPTRQFAAFLLKFSRVPYFPDTTPTKMFFFRLLSLLSLLTLQIAGVASSPIEIRAARQLTAGCTKTPGWSSSDWNSLWALRRQLCSGQGTFQAQYGYKTGGDMQVKLNGKLQKAGIYLAMIFDINEAEAGGSGNVFPEAECYVSPVVPVGIPCICGDAS